MQRIEPAKSMLAALRAANDFAWMEDSPHILPHHLLLGAFEIIIGDRFHFGAMPNYHRYQEIRNDMIVSLELSPIPEHRPEKKSGGRIRDIVQNSRLRAIRRGGNYFFVEDAMFATLAFRIEKVDQLLSNARVDSQLREQIWIYCRDFTAPQCQRVRFAHRPQHTRRVHVMR